MVYKEKEYTLYVKHIKLKGKNDKLWPMYFFSKRIPKSGEPCDLPAGYMVGVNTKTGLPYLKKK